MIVDYDNVDALWAAAAADLGREGSDHGSRAGGTLEVLGWSARLNDAEANVLQNPIRKFDPAYACAELLWYLSGDPCVSMMCEYAPSYKKFANPQEPEGRAHGAYGERILGLNGFTQGVCNFHNREGSRVPLVNDQLAGAVHLLAAKPETRQCVVSLWRETDLAWAMEGSRNDTPCTIALQFLLRESRLHAVAYMRSNDIWLGMPYDIFCFTSLQRIMANWLGVRMGSYTHHVGSLHSYERNAAELSEVQHAMDRPSEELRVSEVERHHYRNGSGTSGAWDCGKAVLRERVARTMNQQTDQCNELGGLPADAAVVCVAKVMANRGMPKEIVSKFILDNCSNAALREAWRIKYGF